jgi:nucleotide-binding universal stress UspA family protein
MILICYDGSDDAKAAITHVGQLLPGADATLLTVWEPFEKFSPGGRSRLSPLSTIVDPGAADERLHASARELVDEGVELAAAAGLKAEPATTEQHDSVADAILRTAEELDADVIVLGSRGHGMLGSMLGSTSHKVLQQADRMVLVIPSPKVAARRHRLLAHETEDVKA